MSKKNAKKSSVKRLNKRLYKAELERLQTELVEMQQWVASSGQRVLVLFEGRDAAGKGGAIKRVMEYLNPRHARVVALPKPSKKERGQWYFQRYIERLPTAGEIVLMDRSWYNRAGVERVMGYCTEDKYQEFLRQAPIVENLLIEDGIILIKYWFSVSDDEQQARFASRVSDPMRRWKLSPTDLESILRWEDYSRAKDAMFAATDTQGSPWWTVESDDKRSARLNVINHLLSTIPRGRIELDEVSIPDRPDGGDYERPPAEQFNYVPDIAADLSAAKSKKAA
ncbi:polyphosphate kinase 2 [Microbacterium trichothecenolyticum]|uniref:polyphosphate kinase 2 n=1 Tax=Microbacterium trichothecenolyticum TaxID=69370 RepID=UPI002859AA89|nr:polyphosphate kinase 2 [Microbacterium trichothecenolyticum]MDR7111036.1 polyphosphate kinase 2 [Microbacterium trichothecenolyticum]